MTITRRRRSGTRTRFSIGCSRSSKGSSRSRDAALAAARSSQVGAQLRPGLVRGGLPEVVEGPAAGDRGCAARVRRATALDRRDAAGNAGTGAAPPQGCDSWGADRRGEPKALYKANRRFKRRMRWLKRKAYNVARSVLRKAATSSTCGSKVGDTSGVSPVLAGTPESTKISHETAVVTAPVMAGNNSPPPQWPTRTTGV